MLKVNKADGSVTALQVLGAVPGENENPLVGVKAKFVMNISEELFESLPFCSEAVCAIVADDHESGDREGVAPISTHIAVKRPFEAATYTLISHDVTVDLHGDVAGRATIKLVGQHAALIWTVQANVNPYELPSLALMVGNETTQVTIEPKQMDFAAILEMGKVAVG